jgi:hypothetical protein
MNVPGRRVNAPTRWRQEMRVLDRAAIRLARYSRRRLVWRSLFAAPFARSAVMTLILGLATIDSPHAPYRCWRLARCLPPRAALVVETSRVSEA